MTVRNGRPSPESLVVDVVLVTHEDLGWDGDAEEQTDDLVACHEGLKSLIPELQRKPQCHTHGKEHGC